MSRHTYQVVSNTLLCGNEILQCGPDLKPPAFRKHLRSAMPTILEAFRQQLDRGSKPIVAVLVLGNSATVVTSSHLRRGRKEFTALDSMRPSFAPYWSFALREGPYTVDAYLDKVADLLVLRVKPTARWIRAYQNQ